MRFFRPSKRTDLAYELVKSKLTTLNEHVSRTDVTLDNDSAIRIGKRAGKYVTLVSPVVAKGQQEYYRRLEKALADAIKEFVGDGKTYLIIGLGNPSMTADALGKSVVERIKVTRGFSLGKREICTLCPNVLGVTGIESFDVVRGVVKQIKPDFIIAVDSLCAASSERLCTAFQLTDTGIAPGSGVSNFRYRIDSESMGVPVLSVGVPLVVYSSTLTGEKVDESEDDLIVTPKDIDVLVEECAEIIASAINSALY